MEAKNPHAVALGRLGGSKRTLLSAEERSRIGRKGWDRIPEDQRQEVKLRQWRGRIAGGRLTPKGRDQLQRRITELEAARAKNKTEAEK